MPEEFKKSCLLSPTPAPSLRLMYEADVVSLREAALAKLRSHESEEDVARWVVGERNALKERYRKLSPAPVMARIVARTMARYGSMTGPTVDELRANGKSWAEIIDSATRPGDHAKTLFQS